MRQVVHAVVASIFWVLLVGAWVLLAAQGKVTAGAVADSIGVIAVMALLVGGLTLYWVRHNVRIYRRKGPRRGRPGSNPNITADRLARPVTWQFDDGHHGALQASHILVDLVGHVKVYSPADPSEVPSR